MLPTGCVIPSLTETTWLPCELGVPIIFILQLRKFHIKKLTVQGSKLGFKPGLLVARSGHSLALHLEFGRWEGGGGERGETDSRALSWEVLIWKILSVALETVFDKL